ncbi:MAG: hypothetical protein AAFQ99_07785, partial [Pseudomonadota bacterium]
MLQQQLQESVVGMVLPSLVIGLLPFAYVPPLGQRLLKHLIHLLKIFDLTLQHMFALKASPEESKNELRVLQLRVKKNQSYDFHRLAWLQDLTKTTAILVGRFAAAVCAGDVWGLSPAASLEASHGRWLNSQLFVNGLEPSCIALIERHGALPEDRMMGRESDSTFATRDEGAIYSCWDDVAADRMMCDSLCDWIRRDFYSEDRSYAIIMQQIARAAESRLVMDFECAIMAVLLKRNDLVAQARLFVANRVSVATARPTARVPRRFLALWCAVARATSWLWRHRSELRAASTEPAAVEAFARRALASARTLLLFAHESVDASRGLSYVPVVSMPESPSRPRTSASSKWKRAIALLRSMLRWRRLYGGQSADNARGTLRTMQAKGLLQCATDVVDFISDVSSVEHGSSGLGCQFVVLVVRNYYRARWRRAGIQTFISLLRSLETQSSQACILYSLTRLQTHPRVEQHVLHDLAATGVEVRLSLEEAFEHLCHEITNIISCISQRNGYGATDSPSSSPKPPRVLGAAEAQLLMVALNALSWNYSHSDWRYLKRIAIVRSLHILIENLD